MRRAAALLLPLRPLTAITSTACRRRAVAKSLLSRQELGLAEIAERVGYGSASAFSTAFSRHVGQPPSRYARLLPSVVARAMSSGG